MAADHDVFIFESASAGQEGHDVFGEHRLFDHLAGTTHGAFEFDEGGAFIREHAKIHEGSFFGVDGFHEFIGGIAAHHEDGDVVDHVRAR